MKNIFIFFFIILFTSIIYAQDTETIVYDLNKGQFLSGQFSYLKPMTIKGAAILGDGTVDAIQLTVTKVLKKEKETFDINDLKIKSLNKEIEKLTNQNKVLIKTKNNIENDSNIEESQIQELSTIGFGELINTDTENDNAIGALKAEIDKINKEISKKSNEKIKLQSENIDLNLKLGNAKLEEQLWVRKGNETEFSITLQNTLKMTTNYSFDFKIFTQNNNPYPVEKLLDGLMFKIDSAFDNGRFSVYTDVKIKNDIETTINKINNEIFSDVYSIDASNSNVSKTGLKVGDEKIAALIGLFKTYRTSKVDYDGDENQVASTEKNLVDKIKNDNSYQNLTANESTTLLNLIKDPTNYDVTSFQNKINQGGFSFNISAILGRYNYLKVLRDNLIIYQKDSKEAKDSITAQFEFIKGLYTKSGNSSFVKESSGTGETELDGTRLGTTFGIGLASLENNFFQAPSWFLYLAVKIRWDDFDNRAQDKEVRYKSWRSRWATVVGLSYTNNMYYNGQKLNDTYLGFKPVIGLSFEPIKHMDIGAGIISFIPENTSIESMPEIRPYVSLSFDFNLFNYLIQKK